MSIDFRSNQTPKEIVPEGSHAARLYSIVELGTLPNTFPGSEIPFQRKLRLTFELPDEMREFDGVQKPMVIGGKYTISLHEKSTLRPIVEGIVGSLSEDDIENFEIRKLLGKTCLVSVVHRVSKTGKEYAAIASTAKLPKSMKEPEKFNDYIYLDYTDFDEGVYNSLPQFMRDDMTESKEMQSRVGTSFSDTEPPF